MDKKSVTSHKPYIKLKDESGSETVYYSAFYKEIPEEFRLVAEKELNETDAKRKEYVYKLKQSIEEEDISVEDDLLLAFLRNQKFNRKKAETKLKKFLSNFREIRKMLDNLDMEKIERIIDDMGFGILPYRDKHGRLIVYTRPDGFDLDKYSMDDATVVIAAIGLMLLKNPLTTITGVAYFGECRGNSLHVFYPYFKAVKKFSPTLLSAPVRIRRIEVLNPISIVRWLIKVISPFLNKKLVERFSFYESGYDNLHKLYDPNLLPEEFGGSMGHISPEVYKQTALDFIRELKTKHI